jgi:hypothetical protein
MNKNSKIIIAVLVALLLLAIRYIYVLKNITTSSMDTSSFAIKELKCYDSLQYFAIQESLSGAVGANILIKYKVSPSSTFSCVYDIGSEDFEIKNTKSEYFLSFADNFLLLDSGTGPSNRQLIAYDLRSKKLVLMDSYQGPVTVTGDNITYLTKTDQKPSLQNCPDLSSYTANGLNALIMAKVSVDLATGTKKEWGKNQCVASQ